MQNGHTRPPAALRVYGTDGKLLGEQSKVFNHKRYSMRCAAQQKMF